MFDGIPELLDGLTARGKRMAVATSRMEAKCIDMVHELGLPVRSRGWHESAAGARDQDRFGSRYAGGARCDSRQAVMIGDRFNDVEGAHAMGVPLSASIRARRRRGAQAAGADAVVHSAAELAKLFAI